MQNLVSPSLQPPTPSSHAPWQAPPNNILSIPFFQLHCCAV